jgi:hypothetical protein
MAAAIVRRTPAGTTSMPARISGAIPHVNINPKRITVTANPSAMSTPVTNQGESAILVCVNNAVPKAITPPAQAGDVEYISELIWPPFAASCPETKVLPNFHIKSFIMDADSPFTSIYPGTEKIK